MEAITAKLISRMIDYEIGKPALIHHFLKVHNYAAAIGQMEGLDEKTLFILETAAVVHDIGIPYADQLCGHHEGPLQEKYGPALAEKMLSELGYEQDVIQRVAYLVGHHHTYHDVDGIDYRILLEADFLVNSLEEGLSKEAIRNFMDKVFETETGIRMLTQMFEL